jgi:hypothetical protein
MPTATIPRSRRASKDRCEASFNEIPAGPSPSEFQFVSGRDRGFSFPDARGKCSRPIVGPSALDRDMHSRVSSTEGAMNENVHRNLTHWDIRDYLDLLR